jgi:hypothetical protein
MGDFGEKSSNVGLTSPEFKIHFLPEPGLAKVRRNRNNAGDTLLSSVTHSLLEPPTFG